MRFYAYDLSLELVRALQAPLATIRTRSRDEADQLQRASHSVARNLAEGSGRFGRDRAQHHRIAYGSLLEAKASLDIAVACGWIASDEPAIDLADKVGAVLWRLAR
jgi:four helix bundle protein|nr:four helix bundle protein [Kofleriaceae bacterium]